MSTDNFIRINGPRVEKIRAMLQTILTSAASNKADPKALLEPLIEDLRELGLLAPETPAPAAASAATAEVSAHQLVQMVNSITVDQTASLLTILAERMAADHRHLHEKRGA
ncbi:MAG: hypothetical protein AAF674_16580 [Pseudomonadota bacterium]